MANSAEAVWKTVREIKLDDIRKAALNPIKVALVGSEDEIVWLQDHFSGRTEHAGDLRRLADTLQLFEAPVSEEALPRINDCTLVCITPNAAADLHAANLGVKPPLYTVGNEGEWDHFKREILDTRWDLHLSLGRNLPGLRPDVVEYTVTNMACVNAEIAVASALLTKVPWIGPIYPGVAFGDTVLLTKNQAMMAFRLAGACGLSIDVVHLKSEVASIIFSGIMARTAARELAGLVPGIGIAIKGAIAYAGTYAVGKTIAHFFDTGSRLTKKEQRTLYEQALERGRQVASERIGRIFRRPTRFRRRSNRTG